MSGSLRRSGIGKIEVARNRTLKMTIVIGTGLQKGSLPVFCSGITYIIFWEAVVMLSYLLNTGWDTLTHLPFVVMQVMFWQRRSASFFCKHEVRIVCLQSMKQISFAKTCRTLLQKAEGSGYLSPCKVTSMSRHRNNGRRELGNTAGKQPGCL